MEHEPVTSARRWILWSVALSVLASLLLLVVPGFASETPGGTSVKRAIDVIGPRALLVLIPPGIALLTLLASQIGGTSRRAVALVGAILLGACCLLTLPSVGLLFLPSATCMLVAFGRSPAPDRRRRPMTPHAGSCGAPAPARPGVPPSVRLR
ncbi:hypothetical protein [Microbispora sp. CA-102843]|uniref:hypothetical protein n=1 Tax=Microbispora sp. CA-102843 TaxID=3239952 RepID=UPI003D908ABF